MAPMEIAISAQVAPTTVVLVHLIATARNATPSTRALVKENVQAPSSIWTQTFNAILALLTVLHVRTLPTVA